MNLKDWEIYQKTKSQPMSTPMIKREETTPTRSDSAEELRRVVHEIEKLPDEYVKLATRILKQLL